jgi:hypothetical protein
MKKAIFYSILILGIFSNVINARSIAMGNDAVQKNTSQKIKNETNAVPNVFSSSAVFQKDDFIIDSVDYDEYDFDEHETSLRSKPYFVTIITPNNNPLKVDLNSDSSCSKIYYHANFSRLPRHNYISLRVLRL